MLLRDWRKTAGLTLAEASDMFGMSIGSLSEVERGTNLPLPERVVAIWAATREHVALDDHWVAWCKANPEKFIASRDAGRAALKNYPKLVRLKGTRYGGKSQKRR